jgi:hypothetical protein
MGRNPTVRVRKNKFRCGRTLNVLRGLAILLANSPPHVPLVYINRHLSGFLKSSTSVAFPPYRDITDELQAAVWMMTLASGPSYAFSLNLTPRVIGKSRVQTLVADLHESLRRNLRRQLRREVDFWFSLEFELSNDHPPRPHLHGGIGLSAAEVVKARKALLLTAGPPSRGKKYLSKFEKTWNPHGWSQYTTKDRIISQRLIDGPLISASNRLRRDAKNFYEVATIRYKELHDQSIAGAGILSAAGDSCDRTATSPADHSKERPGGALKRDGSSTQRSGEIIIEITSPLLTKNAAPPDDKCEDGYAASTYDAQRSDPMSQSIPDNFERELEEVIAASRVNQPENTDLAIQTMLDLLG